MNDQETNRYIINYIYSKYSHYSYGDNNKYKCVDTIHPSFDYHKYHFIQLLYNTGTKSNIYRFKEYICKDNKLTSAEAKQIYLKTYLQIQHLKKSLHKFINICRYKVLKKYNKTNIMYEPLKDNYLALIEDNIIYNFDFFELKKVVLSCFNFMDYRIPKVIDVKNPYTNLPFQLHNLYNIYFYFIKNNDIPLSFHIFMKKNLKKNYFQLCFDKELMINCFRRAFIDFKPDYKIKYIKRMFRLRECDNLQHLPDKIILNHFQTIGLNYFIYEHLQKNYVCEGLEEVYKAKFRIPLRLIYNKNKFYNRKYYKRTLHGNFVKYHMNTFYGLFD